MERLTLLFHLPMQGWGAGSEGGGQVGPGASEPGPLALPRRAQRQPERQAVGSPCESQFQI